MTSLNCLRESSMTKVIEAVYVKKPIGLGVGVYAIHDCNGFDPNYLTAILNSKYLTYYINIKFKDKHLAGGYLAINKSTLEKLPLVKPKKEHEVIISKKVEEIFLEIGKISGIEISSLEFAWEQCMKETVLE